jgi:hypothetical protein
MARVIVPAAVLTDLAAGLTAMCARRHDIPEWANETRAAPISVGMGRTAHIARLAYDGARTNGIRISGIG